MTRLTACEPRHEAMRVAIQQSAFPRNTNGSEDVVACHHHRANVGVEQLLQHTRRGRLELVLENDEADKVKTALNLVSGHLLRLDPGKLRQMARRTANDAIPLVSVIRQELVVVMRD